MSNKGSSQQPARASERLFGHAAFETRDFALARNRRRKANKAAKAAKRKNRR